MKNKKWSIFIIIGYFISLLILVFCIYSSFKYLKYKKGKEKIIMDNRLIGREDKANYIYKNKDYNGFIIGGSKAGALNPEKLNTSECKYYNFWNLRGNTNDYYNFIEFLIKNNDKHINNIVLHLSTSEITDNVVVRKPINMYDSSIQKIIVGFPFVLEKYTNIENLVQNINLSKTDYGVCSDYNGKRIFPKNDYNWINEHVLQNKGWYWRSLDGMFTNKTYRNNTFSNVDIKFLQLEQIKELCEKNDIKLTVIIGPTFLLELQDYMDKQYYDILRRLVNLFPIYNFSGINDININPYNFLDVGHYRDYIGDAIIEKVFLRDDINNAAIDDFGVLLTPKNIEDYISSQNTKFIELKDEYNNTGKIKFTFNDHECFYNSKLIPVALHSPMAEICSYCIKDGQISVLVKNTGTEEWSIFDFIKLCVWKNNKDSGYRITIPYGEIIKPQQIVEFKSDNFPFDVNKSDNLKFGMLQEGIQYFGKQKNIQIPLQFPNADIIDYSINGKNVSVFVKNIGTEEWGKGNLIRLGVWKDNKDSGYRIDIPSEEIIEPNQIIEFKSDNFSFDVNKSDNLEFQMLQEGIQYFGQKKLITVNQ